MSLMLLQPVGLSLDGLADALRRVAAVKLSKIPDLVRLVHFATKCLFSFAVTALPIATLAR